MMPMGQAAWDGNDDIVEYFHQTGADLNETVSVSSRDKLLLCGAGLTGWLFFDSTERAP